MITVWMRDIISNRYTTLPGTLFVTKCLYTRPVSRGLSVGISVHGAPSHVIKYCGNSS